MPVKKLPKSGKKPVARPQRVATRHGKILVKPSRTSVRAVKKRR